MSEEARVASDASSANPSKKSPLPFHEFESNSSSSTAQTSTHEREKDAFDASPKKTLEEPNYNKKVKYLANTDFTIDNSSFYPMEKSPPRSIPNTFKFKSHPNARTKASIGDLMEESERSGKEKSEKENDRRSIENRNEGDGNRQTTLDEPHEIMAQSKSNKGSKDEINKESKDANKEESKDAIHEGSKDANKESKKDAKEASKKDAKEGKKNGGNHGSNNSGHGCSAPGTAVTPPIRTSTIKEPVDFNTTPEWMPSELREKWVSDESQPHQIDVAEDFSSSVRIHRSKDAPLDELCDLGSGTMIHKALSKNQTPMWERARKKFEVQKEPKLHNIFMSMDSSEVKDSKINAHSISSTLSTPMATMNNQHFGSAGRTGPLENSALRYPNKPDSPLKLFHDNNYNTFTKQVLDGMLSKINKSNAHTPYSGRDRQNEQKEQNEQNEQNEQRDVDNESRNSWQEAQTSWNAEAQTSWNAEAQNTWNAEAQNTWNTESHQESHEPEYPRFKSRLYTEEYFKQNADNVFNNLQRKGFRSGQDLTGRRSVSNTHTTATSTPKNYKVDDDVEYSTFSSDMENTSESNFQQISREWKKKDISDDSYTFDEMSEDDREVSRNEKGTESKNESRKNSRKNEKKMNEKKMNESSKNEMYSEFSGSKNESKNSKNGSSRNTELSKNTELSNDLTHDSSSVSQTQLGRKVSELEKLLRSMGSGQILKDIEELMKENSQLKAQLEAQKAPKEMSEISIDHADFSVENYHMMQDFIKWKRASQLKLAPSPKPPISILKERNATETSFVKGRVNPGIELPVAYDNMVLDVKNQKWVTCDDKENYAHSLDSIEDLVSSDSEKGKKKKGNSKLEVSFHLPHMENHSSPSSDASLPAKPGVKKSKSRSPLSSDVTQVSQLEDMTFSLTQKNLVSVITETLAITENFQNESWNEVAFIDFSSRQLDSIKDLNKFLPNLSSINLAHNHLKFLDGLPKHILNLNVAHNNLESITSFYQYRDIQHLDASGNRLTNLTNFSRNLHVTDLNLSLNKLTSIAGVTTMVNLTRLNVSGNDLRGEVSFRGCGLANLEDLNMSENKITAISGLESLPNLKVLNLNENQLFRISARGKHRRLKKLLLKFNMLQDLSLDSFPNLRVVRLDGNLLSKTSSFSSLKYLEEVSVKAQHDHVNLRSILEQAKDVRKMDLSGNSRLKLQHLVCEPVFRHPPFLNMNCLVLSAMNLSSLPDDFARVFPNVSELNLNFNRLKDIAGLAKMRNVRKLYLVSNNITTTEAIISGLIGTRSRMREIDLRLNPCNMELYPYVFSPQELELGKGEEMSPIQLETLDDIESFAIHYESLAKAGDWQERDAKFISKLISEEGNNKVEQRLNYETLLVNFFRNLRKLDGGGGGE